IVSNFGWRWVFFAGIPVGLLAMLSAALVLKGRTERQSARSSRGTFDWLGATLSSAALVAFLLAMTNAWKLGWISPLIVAGFASSVILVAAFIIWEMRAPDPMLDLSLFSSRVFSLAISARFFSFLGGSAIFFLMPFYLIQGLGYPASRAALLMIPGSLCMAIVAPFAGRLSDRFGTRWLAAAGLMFSAAGMFNLSLLSIESPAWQIMLGIFLSGLGMATFSSPNTSAIMGSLAPEKYGIVSGFVNLARTSANVTGVALSTTFVTITMASYGFEPTLSVLTQGGGEGVRVAFVEGLSLALKVSCGLILLALALTLFRTGSNEIQPEPAASAQRTPASGGD
ncbi:MAG: MFS transporter, partial [Dehalococcoidia bacterium]|nr:MFS transporter [Dehalococcoidia bacterium]